MPLHVTIGDALLRVSLAFIGAALVGFNREERNEAAGMRTTILVCMAACIATLLANILLDTTGKDQSYFSQIDVMRLPLGILSGIGFIGAGAIMKKGDMALGVTTAATVWFISVVGICFGSGQVLLGGLCVILTLMTLWALKWFDQEMPRAMRALLEVEFADNACDDRMIRKALEDHRYKLISLSVRHIAGRSCFEATVQWEGSQKDAGALPPLLLTLTQLGSSAVSWKPSALAS